MCEGNFDNLSMAWLSIGEEKTKNEVQFINVGEKVVGSLNNVWPLEAHDDHAELYFVCISIF